MTAFGLAYYYFSSLLMTIYDPTISRIGPMYLAGQKRIKVTSPQPTRVISHFQANQRTRMTFFTTCDISAGLPVQIPCHQLG